MTYSTFDPTDSLPVVEVKLDADAARHEALQTATGIPEGTANLGAGSVGEGAPGSPVAGDTAVARFVKNQSRIKALEDSSTAPADQNLGVDFPLDEITGTVRGTTSIEGAIESQYPDGVGLYLVEAFASVVLNSFAAGDVITIVVSKRTSAGIIRQWIGATTADVNEVPIFKEISGPITTGQIVDRNVTRAKLALDALHPVQRELAVPTDDVPARSMTGGPFEAMPIQVDDRFVMTKTPHQLFVEAGFQAAQEDWYVDGILGDDGNPGTAALPYKTIEFAMALQPNASTVFGTVWVAPGVYDWRDGWSGKSPDVSAPNDILLGDTASYAVRRWNNGRAGEVILSTHFQGTQWGVSPVATTTNVYTVSNSSCVNVVDPGHRQPNGAFARYTQITFGNEAARDAAVDATEGTWHIRDVGDEVSVHRIGGGRPGFNTLLICFDAENVQEESNRTIYVEGITFVGGKSAFKATCGTAGNTGGNLYMASCKFYSSGTQGLRTERFTTTYLANCEAYGNGLDGIQGFGLVGSLNVNVITYNCHSDDNGHATPETNNINGFSNHNDMRGLHVAGSAKGNKGPQWADITGTQTWWVGCTAGYNTSTTGTVAQSSFSVLTASKGWAYRCEAPSYYASASPAVQAHDQCAFGAFSGPGTPVPYTQV